MNQTRHRRSRKLIQPRLQLRLIGSFVGLAALAMGVQFLLLGHRTIAVASQLNGGAGDLVDQVPRIMLQVYLYSLGITLPIIFLFGILLTFPIAGPIHRFETYLRSVARGEQVGPCKIRDGDQLGNLCEAINAATEPIRRRRLDAVEDGSAEDEPERDSSAA